MQIEDSLQRTYVAPGMPPLAQEGRTVSFFEFWPTWLIYLPVVIQWLALSIRHRSLTLPLLANPQLPLSGMVGVPKSLILSHAGPICNEYILPWFVFECTQESNDIQAANVCEKMLQKGFDFPVVCKPDIGCRGSGVKLVHSREGLSDYISSYPKNAGIMVQQLADYEPEVGIFFVREPGSQQGEIISLALKYSPYVVGDGKKTLGELIEQDPRAGKLAHLYADRHAVHWNSVIPKAEPFKLVFSASHCRGAIFRDANDFITPELVESLNHILSDLPEFYYGRLDVKFADIESLKHGKTLQIIEINTASSESLHIWDRNTRLREALRSLMKQYRILFKLGQLNRKRGYTPPGIRALLRHWSLERRLTRAYPATD